MAVVVVFTILAVWTVLILVAAAFPSRPLPEGLMALMTGVAMAAIGLPAALSLRFALRKRDDEEGGK